MTALTIVDVGAICNHAGGTEGTLSSHAYSATYLEYTDHYAVFQATSGASLSAGYLRVTINVTAYTNDPNGTYCKIGLTNPELINGAYAPALAAGDNECGIYLNGCLVDHTGQYVFTSDTLTNWSSGGYFAFRIWSQIIDLTPDSIAFTVTAAEWISGGGDPPVADFVGTPRSGPATLSVAFTDLSTNTPTSWAWDFGDGGSSTDQNPTHDYTADGIYTVSLTATNDAGSDDEIKVAYIIVSGAGGGGSGGGSGGAGVQGGPAYIVNCRYLSAVGAGAVGLRVSNTAYALNTRTDATTGVVIDNGGVLYAYGLQYGSATLTGTGALVPLAGDRSAYDALNYQDIHANDINDAAGIHHTTANMGSFFVSNVLDAGSIFVGNASNIATPYILSGDATLDPSGVLTLNTVNPDVGVFGDSTFVPRITVNAKGLITAVSDVAIAAATGGHTIQDEGTPLTARANLNFVGAGVTATDDAGNNATVVTIPSGSGVTRSGATTDGHLAVWNGSSADSIKDGGTVPAGTVTSVGTGTGLTGGPITGSGTVTLADTAVSPGAYTNADITVDQQGRITAAANGSAGSGTVTSVATGTGLTGGPITTTGTVSLADTAVTPGAYTSANITVDQQGRITAAANGTGGTGTGGVPQVYNEIQIADGVSTVYHLANYANPGTIRVYKDGIRLPATDDTSATDEVIFDSAPTLGSVLVFDYEMELI